MYFYKIKTEDELINKINSVADVNIPDGLGTTLLYYAAMLGFMNAVRLLCDKNVDINKTSGYGDNNSLNIACEKHHVEIIKLLIDKGAKPVCENKANAINSSGIIRLLERNEDALVKTLVEKGWAVNSFDLNDNTIINMSIKKQNVEIFKLLLDKGARIEKQDIDLIIQTNNDEILLFLLVHQYKNDSMDEGLWSNPNLKDLYKIATFLNLNNNSEYKLPIKEELIESEKLPLFLEIVFSNPSNLFYLDEIIIPLVKNTVSNQEHNTTISILGDIDLLEI